MTGDHKTADAIRSRWHSAGWWASVGSIASAAALFVAALAWWFPQSPDSPNLTGTPPSSTLPTTAPTSLSPPATTIPSQTLTTTSPSREEAGGPIYADKKIVLPPARCTTFDQGIDFDEAVVYPVRSSTRDIVDLTYHACASYFGQEGDAFVGVGPDDLPTPAACASLAKAQPIGELGERTVKAGQAWCVVTSSGQVAWAKITRVSFSADNSYVGVDLLVTLWTAA